MWCRQCRQDVPAVASTDGGEFCCPRCGGGFSADQSRSAAADAGSDPPPYDGWELDQQLRHIERVLAAGQVGTGGRKGARQSEPGRLDPPHAGPSAWHLHPAGKPSRASKPDNSRSHATLTALSWAALLLGTMTFVCGGILLGWSLVTGRAELWTVGMPVALCGQIALLVGLILQLDRLWQDSRRAADKLEDVDQQLHELKTTTTILGTGHNSPASAFYSHFADGAGPRLLLSDLKSQLDLLALKMSMNDE